MKKKLTQKIVVYITILFIATTVDAQFVHPGLSHKTSDLDRMKAMVEAQIDPWYASYQELAASSFSSYDYEVQGDVSMTVLYRDSPQTNLAEFEDDSRAAYQNALMWSITGDSRYADKAVEIFNAWTGLTYLQHSGTRALTSSLIYIMVEGAEIIKNTYSGWSTSDIDEFKAMLVYPGYSNTAAPSDLTTQGTWYWRAYLFDYVRAGNQELSAIRACLAMGVFLDNEIMYDRALRYVKGLSHRSDDIPYSSGPHITGSVSSTSDYQISYNYTIGSSVEDYGFNGVLTNYIWESGQSQESSRDLWHTWWGEYMLCNVGEIAWNQGSDFWSEEDSRILLGLEYNNRYTVSYVQSYSDQLTEWTPTVESGEFLQRMDATGRTKSLAIAPYYNADITRLYRDRFNDVDAWELPVAHYVGRGIKTADEVKWTVRARDKSIEMNGTYETSPTNGSYLGYGGLTCRRPDYCYGEPISGFDSDGLPIYAMNILPMTIEAENFDYSPASQEGRTYSETTTANAGGKYRTDEAVDIQVCDEGGYNVGWTDSGEYLTYTVSVPETGTYDLSIRYASPASTGTVKVLFGGSDKTGFVSLPTTSDWQIWSDLTLASNVTLTQGVQSMKILVGTGDFNINTITIDAVETSCDLPWSRSDFTVSERTVAYTTPSIDISCASNVNVSMDIAGIGQMETADYLNVYYQVDGGSYVAISENTKSFSEKTISVSGISGSSIKLKINSMTNVAEETFYVSNINVVSDDLKSAEMSSSLASSMNDSKLLIYPNPVKQNFTVANRKGAQLEVYNSLGKLVYRSIIESDNYSVSMEDYEFGMYIVNMITNETIESHKVIKQ